MHLKKIRLKTAGNISWYKQNSGWSQMLSTRHFFFIDSSKAVKSSYFSIKLLGASLLPRITRKGETPLLPRTWGWGHPSWEFPGSSSRCQQRPTHLPPSLPPPRPFIKWRVICDRLTVLWRKAAIFACLCTRFVFLISFHWKVYQLLYHQSEAFSLSLFFFLSPSVPLLFVPGDNQCLWSQLPLLIFHYSLI